MLRYKTETRPGLVALYDIRPGNRAGQFLQPWSPHGAAQPTVSGVKHRYIIIHIHQSCTTYDPRGPHRPWFHPSPSSTFLGYHKWPAMNINQVTKTYVHKNWSRNSSASGGFTFCPGTQSWLPSQTPWSCHPTSSRTLFFIVYMLRHPWHTRRPEW